jgi:hypothetical protein
LLLSGPIAGHALGLLSNHHHQIGCRVHDASATPPCFAQRKQRFIQWIADLIDVERLGDQTQTRTILQQITATLFLEFLSALVLGVPQIHWAKIAMQIPFNDTGHVHDGLLMGKPRLDRQPGTGD